MAKNLLGTLLSSGMAPAKLVEEIRDTEAGKLASEMGAVAYRTFSNDGQTIIGSCPSADEVRKLFYAVQAMLEDYAMREVFAKHFKG